MSFSSMELPIVQMLNSYPALDPLMVFLSVMGEGPLWVLIGFYLYLSGSKRTAVYFGLMLLSVWVAATVLKSWLMVPRPEDVRFVVEASGYSMPSIHSGVAFAAAMFLHQIAGKYSYLLWTVALMMAVSRVFAGVHYPSDVIAGAVLGILMGYIWIRIGVGSVYVQKREESD
ncbi:undecaprenyl-diphosphatase [Methanococcoides vulcani]|uniref:Undecaprenyl-diphosphatase n=1 Tax=Methanococcoides vulcani TaxID=1353158 RepID=A0A1H9ZDH2_9EURY|nr:phosphatase PAP2 family protein [Methanococcoides vulcani]SES79377.1 undecaprenyl-diphosphatase [Methanococcoides vulcani]